jgi:hypothetical protein
MLNADETKNFSFYFSEDYNSSSPPLLSKTDFSQGNFKSHEIFMICWDYSGEAVVTFSARCRDV